MLRVIFDTNIYGLLLTENDLEAIERRIREEKDFIVYGYKPVRKEIRDIPKVTKLSKQTRVRLLTLYDKITGKHFFENSIKITLLAKKYYYYYRNVGGIYNWDTGMRVDLMIVACATFHGIDIVYSHDNKTLLGKKALKSYHHVNINENYRTPNFLTYKDLLAKFRNKL